MRTFARGSRAHNAKRILQSRRADRAGIFLLKLSFDDPPNWLHRHGRDLECFRWFEPASPPAFNGTGARDHKKQRPLSLIHQHCECSPTVSALEKILGLDHAHG